MRTYNRWGVSNGNENTDLARKENDMNYYIQGDAAKADKIKAAFESKGFVPRIAPMYCGSESVLFFTGIDGYIYETSSPWVMEIIKTNPDYEELELPKPHYDIANFKPFDKVLVRDNDRGKWRPSIFSYHIKGRQTRYPFCCIGNSYSQCIPYEGNEHLFGTTDMCDEMYINW